MPQGSITSSPLQRCKPMTKHTLSVSLKTKVPAVNLLINVRLWSTRDLAISHWTSPHNKLIIREQMPECSSIPSLPKKCPEGLCSELQNSKTFPAAVSLLNHQLMFSLEAPKHTPKASDMCLTCEPLATTQRQCLSKQQQMLKQKLQQQIPCGWPSARTWGMLVFLPEYVTHKQVAEQGQASWKTSLNFIDACMTTHFRHCNCLISLL